MSESFKEDWQLTEAEKQQDYENNLIQKIDATTTPIDTLHTFFGHEEIKTLPEDKAQQLYEKLSTSIQKLLEIKNNLEVGNPYLNIKK